MFVNIFFILGSWDPITDNPYSDTRIDNDGQRSPIKPIPRPYFLSKFGGGSIKYSVFACFMNYDPTYTLGGALTLYGNDWATFDFSHSAALFCVSFGGKGGLHL